MESANIFQIQKLYTNAEFLVIPNHSIACASKRMCLVLHTNKSMAEHIVKMTSDRQCFRTVFPVSEHHRFGGCTFTKFKSYAHGFCCCCCFVSHLFQIMIMRFFFLSYKIHIKQKRKLLQLRTYYFYYCCLLLTVTWFVVSCGILPPSLTENQLHLCYGCLAAHEQPL